MTRAMLVSVLWRMEGEPAHTDRNPFTDVGTDWYTDGVLWAAEHDIVSGNGDGRFDPNGYVTRADRGDPHALSAEHRGLNGSKKHARTRFGYAHVCVCYGCDFAAARAANRRDGR